MSISVPDNLYLETMLPSIKGVTCQHSLADIPRNAWVENPEICSDWQPARKGSDIRVHSQKGYSQIYPINAREYHQSVKLWDESTLTYMTRPAYWHRFTGCLQIRPIGIPAMICSTIVLLPSYKNEHADSLQISHHLAIIDKAALYHEGQSSLALIPTGAATLLERNSRPITHSLVSDGGSYPYGAGATRLQGMVIMQSNRHLHEQLDTTHCQTEIDVG
jgi:hypothetical protein